LKALGTAAFTVPFITHNLISAPPSERVRYAAIGTANMAGADLAQIVSHPSVDFVAAVDVDANYLKAQKGINPNLKTYTDYRVFLEREKDIDCVTVSTPDHAHAVIAMSAMQMGIHVYGQKPMAHDVYEVRKLTEYAREHSIITQLGIQIHAESYYRSTVKILREGIIGKIKETYSWCSNSYVAADQKFPDKKDTPPANLNWDLWLNTAAERPFIAGFYHPGVWRKCVDLGTGAMGDMACHIFDNVFGSLDLTAPESIVSEGNAPTEYFWANNSKVHYTFPGTAFTADKIVKVHWYDGKNRPPQGVIDMVGGKVPNSGSIFVGTEGVLMIQHYGTPPRIFKKNGDKYEEVPEVAKLMTIPSINHWHSFVDAVKGGEKTQANFDYAGPLTEAVLLGTVATRFPQTVLKWDATKLEFDKKEANYYLRRSYRKGWNVKGL